jgi:hypothetical protein
MAEICIGGVGASVKLTSMAAAAAAVGGSSGRSAAAAPGAAGILLAAVVLTAAELAAAEVAAAELAAALAVAALVEGSRAPPACALPPAPNEIRQSCLKTKTPWRRRWDDDGSVSVRTAVSVWRVLFHLLLIFIRA